MKKIEDFSSKHNEINEEKLINATMYMAYDLVNYIRETQSFEPELINAAINAVDTVYSIVFDW